MPKNILLTMASGLIKGKFNPGALTGVEDIQADAYAANASQGVDIVKGWMGGRTKET